MNDDLDNLIFELLEDYELITSCDNIIEKLPVHLDNTSYVEELMELIDSVTVKEDNLKLKLEEYSRDCEKNNIPKDLNYIRIYRELKKPIV